MTPVMAHLTAVHAVGMPDDKVCLRAAEVTVTADVTCPAVHAMMFYGPKASDVLRQVADWLDQHRP